MELPVDSEKEKLIRELILASAVLPPEVWEKWLERVKDGLQRGKLQESSPSQDQGSAK